MAKPRLQEILMIIFSLYDITSQLQKTKLCALPFIANYYVHVQPFKILLIVIVMPEMFQQCLQERTGKRQLYENL